MKGVEVEREQTDSVLSCSRIYGVHEEGLRARVLIGLEHVLGDEIHRLLLLNERGVVPRLALGLPVRPAHRRGWVEEGAPPAVLGLEVFDERVPKLSVL